MSTTAIKNVWKCAVIIFIVLDCILIGMILIHYLLQEPVRMGLGLFAVILWAWLYKHSQ